MNTCSVRKHCCLYQCDDPKNQWISEGNCSCKGCIERYIAENPGKDVPVCEWSGEAYNTDGDCLMEK